jgi:hypothetical protein
VPHRLRGGGLGQPGPERLGRERGDVQYLVRGALGRRRDATPGSQPDDREDRADERGKQDADGERRGQ